MSRKNDNGVSEQWLIDKGYTKEGNTWVPPKMKSKFIESLKGKQHLYVNEDIIEKTPKIKTPEFTHVPKTEWFITGSVPSKKNSRINLKSGISIPSKKHQEYAKQAQMQYEVFGREFRAAVEYFKIEPPYCIEMTFVRSTKHSFDYCNACQTVEDMMKDQYSKKRLIRKGWFEDDNADTIIPSFKPYEYDKNNPGVKIRLIK